MEEPSPAELNLTPRARASRLGFLELGDEDRAALRELAEVLSPEIPRLVDQWYEFLLGREETRGLLAEQLVRDHLKPQQVRYFRELLEARHDEAYFERRVRIGYAHARVGLEPAWYLGAYRKNHELVSSLLSSRGLEPDRVERWMRAYGKAIYLDTALALDAYFAGLHRQLLGANEALRLAAADLEVRNRELVELYRKAQESGRLKEELLSRVSHELGTPLHAILGFTDLLLDGIDGPLADEQEKSLRKVREHGGRLLAMIEGVLEAAKLAASSVEAHPFAPGDVVRAVEKAGRHTAAAKGLGFEVALADELPLVLGDPVGLELALKELVENAVKFTERGAVRLAVEPLPGGVRFSVADSGVGIAKEARARIFDPFFQADGSDRREFGGLGMGLALARQAVEGMGGRLRLESTGPGGSSFGLELRRAEAASGVRPRGAPKRRAACAENRAPRTRWPSGLAGQAAQVRSALESAGRSLSAAEVACRFLGARRSRVAALLEALVALGQARAVARGRFAPVRRS